ncbi:MAG: OmpA family protein [Bacteroidota bacterium]
MKKYTGLALILFLSIMAWSQQKRPSKAFLRLKDRADFFYQNYNFPKAIRIYNEALKEYDSDSIKLRIADSYRRMNQTLDAEKWYKQVLGSNVLTETNMLNYGQILSANGKYDSAAAVFEKYEHHQDWIDKQAKALRDIERFYVNKVAFDIAESYFNSEEKDFSPAYLNDDLVFVSGRKSAGLMKPEYKWDGSNFLDLFVVKGGEGSPEKIQRKINSRMHEGPPVYYAQGERMIFTRNNYLASDAGASEEGVNMLKLYFSKATGEKRWGKPKEFLYNSNNYSTGHPAITADGNTLYFASDMPGGIGGVDLWKSEYQNGQWQAPENLGPRFNTSKDEMFPFLHDDSLLYYSSNGLEGLGGLDLFRLDLSNKVGKPRNLGFPVNTNADDFGITLKRGKSHGYFSSNREGGTGNDDIYDVTIYDYFIRVNLIDSLTREPLSGNIKINEIFPPDIAELVQEKTGNTIVFRALKGSGFKATGAAQGYVPDSLSIATKKHPTDILWLVYDLPLLREIAGIADFLVVKNNGLVSQVFYRKDSSSYQLYEGIELDNLKENFIEDQYMIGETLVLENIFYDFDKYNIREDAAAGLNELVAFMEVNMDAKVDLASHTDVRGSLGYNDRLAKRRAKSAMNYLVKNGIDKSRIKTSDFGETRTFNSCKEEDCSEANHQENRRIVIKLTF